MNSGTGRARGRFVVLDGIDGCGKSTQADRLVRSLREETGREVLHLREPGSTPLGEALRDLLLGRGGEIGPAVEALLFAAARRQMLDQVVAPALARGAHVVVERFHPSTFAYQGVAGGLGEDRVLDLLEVFAGSPEPDLVLLLELPPEAAAARLAGRVPGRSGDREDRIEAKGLAFQRQVADGFRRYAARARGIVVDADREEDEVAASVLAEVRRAFR